MTLWLLVNTALGFLALLFLALNRDAPHRLRFHVCVLALCVWFLPWQRIAGMLPFTALLQVPPETLNLGALLADSVLSESTTTTTSVTRWQLVQEHLLAAAFALGASLFLFAVLRHVLLLRALTASARECANTEIDPREGYQGLLAGSGVNVVLLPPIYPQRLLPGAFTTGVVRPVIWVHEDLLRDELLQVVLLHELTHVRRHDNAWLYLITFVEKLLWWNPLVRLFAAKARRLMEFSCDADCQRESRVYRSKLNRLILDLSRGSGTSRNAQGALCAGMFKDANFNVERIRQLERRAEMKTKNYLSAGMLAIAAVFVIGGSSVFSQSETAGQQANETAAEQAREDNEANRARDQAALDEKMAAIESREGPTQTERELRERKIRVGLEVYADRLEASWNDLSKSKDNLEARVQELEQQLAQQQ